MVSLKEYSQEQLAKKSLINIATLFMQEEKKEMKFSDVFAKVSALKGLSEEEKKAKISQFYTDLNADGSFATNGANMWGLKRWHQKKSEEDTSQAIKKVRRKKSKKVKDEDELDKEFAMINNDIDDIVVEFDEEDEEDLDIDIEIDEEFDGFFEKDE